LRQYLKKSAALTETCVSNDARAGANISLLGTIRRKAAARAWTRSRSPGLTNLDGEIVFNSFVV